MAQLIAACEELGRAVRKLVTAVAEALAGLLEWAGLRAPRPRLAPARAYRGIDPRMLSWRYRPRRDRR